MLPARADAQGQARDEGESPAAAVKKLRVTKGGGVTLVEGTPVNREKSTLVQTRVAIPAH
jgi:hypothetical protein